MGIFLQGFFCCKGAAIMDIETKRVIHTVPHTHDPSHYAVAASRLKSMIKKISGTSRGTPTPIHVDTTASATTGVCALGNP